MGSAAVSRSVLLLRALGLGDFLTGVPAYRAVRRAFPGHRVVLAAPLALAPLVPLTGAIDELLPTGELEAIGWTGPAPDVGIDLHGRGPASHRLVAALRPARLVVFGGQHAGGFTGPVWRADEHEVARWCRLCTESGIPADPADLVLRPPGGTSPSFTLIHPGAAAPGRRRPPGRFAAVPSDLLLTDPEGTAAASYTLVHPGAAAPGRRWPADRFAAVARRLAAAGHAVRITGSESERGLASQVAQQAGLPEECLVAGRTSLTELAALVTSARLVVAGDTGMSHLATAFARPSVTLFGPVPPSEWGPPGQPRHQVLWAAKPGYRGDPHRVELDPALAAITVDDVGRAVARACA